MLSYLTIILTELLIRDIGVDYILSLENDRTSGNLYTVGCRLRAWLHEPLQ